MPPPELPPPDDPDELDDHELDDPPDPQPPPRSSSREADPSLRPLPIADEVRDSQPSPQAGRESQKLRVRLSRR